MVGASLVRDPGEVVGKNGRSGLGLGLGETAFKGGDMASVLGGPWGGRGVGKVESR